jgi:hypothetical protein
VADKNIKEAEIDCYEIPGLGIGTEVSSEGYIVFAKTRSVNEKFCPWWFKTIYIPFVAALRLRYSIDVKIHLILQRAVKTPKSSQCSHGI